MAQKSNRMRPRQARIVLAGTLLAAAALNFGASAADNSLKAVFDRMDQASAKFKGLTANVKYLSHEAVIDENDSNSGAIVVKMPKPHDLHILIDFKDQPKTVQMSGNQVQVFYPKSLDLQIIDVSKANRAEFEQFARLPFGSSSKELQDGYSVTPGGPEKIEGQGTTRIELVPKSKELAKQFPKIELWISDDLGISIQQKLFMQGGNYSIATYTNVQLRSNIPDSAVKLNLPKGVKKTYLSR